MPKSGYQASPMIGQTQEKEGAHSPENHAIGLHIAQFFQIRLFASQNYLALVR
jgi:hypothetical protein